MRNRRRAEARGRALALTQGILAPVGWWRPAAWKQFKSQLPEWMSFQLENWQEEALALNAKERKIDLLLQEKADLFLFPSNNPHDTCEELCRDPKHCPSRECERQEECAQHEYFKATRLAYFCQSLGCFASSRDRKGPEPSVIPRQALI